MSDPRKNPPILFRPIPPTPSFPSSIPSQPTRTIPQQPIIPPQPTRTIPTQPIIPAQPTQTPSPSADPSKKDTRSKSRLPKAITMPDPLFSIQTLSLLTTNNLFSPASKPYLPKALLAKAQEEATLTAFYQAITEQFISDEIPTKLNTTQLNLTELIKNHFFLNRSKINLDDRSELIDLASNNFNEILNTLISISKKIKLQKNAFDSFLKEQIIPHIDYVVSLVLREEIIRSHVTDYIENNSSSFLIENFNLQFGRVLANWVFNKIQCALSENSLDQQMASITLKNSLERIHKTNSLLDIEKIRNMIAATEETISGVTQSLINKNNLLVTTCELVGNLNSVIDDISHVLHDLKLQPIQEHLSFQNGYK